MTQKSYVNKIKFVIFIALFSLPLVIMTSQLLPIQAQTTVVGKLPLLRTIILEKEYVYPAFSQQQIEPVYESTSLAEKINSILQKPLLNGVVTGVSVRKAEDGELIYSHHGDTQLRPASNLKLLTAAVAMEVLGPEYRFSTELLTDGKIKKGVLQGNLYMKGKGDPTLLQKDLDTLALLLKKKGIKKIQGDMIGDDSWYDNARYSQDLIWSDEQQFYGGQISALTISPDEDYDAGSILLDIQPGKKSGSPVIIKMKSKTNYVKIVNKAKTAENAKPDKLSVEREHGSNRIIIQGEVSLETDHTRVKIALWEPTDFAVDLMGGALKKNGITWNGEAKTGVTPESATVLVTIKSMPLKELLIPFMKLSNNIHAETLVKEMGKVIHDDGSWPSGLDVMKVTLADFGLNQKHILIRDGSGISDKNLIPPNELTKLLFEVQKKSWYPAFEQAQPVAGEPDRMIGGTLRSRMTAEDLKGKVKAKTGTLTGVSTLSGYVTNANGEKLIFSIMMNNYIQGSMRKIQDEICQVLIEDG
ncbi:D-alanyl-D-alanine carboxypeptidase/D-alanyl-D-alanine endopeptidase [Bacillus sp. SD088]|uniref:D-alanyl-D-alanine carboxypeptidase/D-alanyl-D-alanine endopeptidase n=1 Tax=Bacillus sp. SD088 TaxID=2782012 RepID=UPI001A974760|nr:D-alanyl-D-alanine carboxypeptidase/D-alanyl-D-alanine-endopeptidase [Bacillus sp. SD088]MBO0992554.1 D-alanyl-D-alanine carboxypeptidase/D-alanyl-D-alanine-endopeptidase [Bacillus sp. SD088]